MVAILALYIFRLPVSLQVTIELVLCLKFFGTLVARKFLFIRMRLKVAAKVCLGD